MKESKFYGKALMLSEDQRLVCCLVQEGTGSTIETSNIAEYWFPYSAMKSIIGNYVDRAFDIEPIQYFSVIISGEDNKISYEFFAEEKTDELFKFLKKPDYFADEDYSFLTADDIIDTPLSHALKDSVWVSHRKGDTYTMDGKNTLWKIVYYPILEDGKNGEVYQEPRALVETPIPGGTDFREIPLRYLTKI